MEEIKRGERGKEGELEFLTGKSMAIISKTSLSEVKAKGIEEAPRLKIPAVTIPMAIPS